MAGDDCVSFGLSCIDQSFVCRSSSSFFIALLTPLPILLGVRFVFAYDADDSENLAAMLAACVTIIDCATEFAGEGIKEEVITFFVGSGSVTGWTPGNDFCADVADFLQSSDVEAGFVHKRR